MRYSSVPASLVTVDLGQGPESVEVESWQVSRTLSGGGVPGQARAVSGSSVGTGSVTLRDALSRTPWHTPATTPGGTVSIDATHDLETVADQGPVGFSPIARMRSRVVDAPSWVSSVRELSIEDPFPRGTVNVPTLLVAGTLDACAIIDMAARSGGYYATRPPLSTTIGSWPFVGSLWNEVPGAPEAGSSISDGARYATADGVAMLADSMVTAHLFSGEEDEGPAFDYTVGFNLWIDDDGTEELGLFQAYVHSASAELLSIKVDAPNLVIESTTDIQSFTLPSMSFTHRIELHKVVGQWRVFIDGQFVGVVLDPLNAGASFIDVLTYGTSYVGGLTVDGSESPEVADASEATWATTTHSYTHTPTETPRAILIAVTGGQAGAQTVTYGGVPVPQVSGIATLSFYYLAAPPTGAQTVAFAGGITDSRYAVVMTIAGDRAVMIGSTDSDGGQVWDSLTVSSLGAGLSVLATRSVGVAGLTSLSPPGGTALVHDNGSDVRVDSGEFATPPTIAYSLPGAMFLYTEGVSFTYASNDQTGVFTPTALISTAHSPLQAMVGGVSGKSWDVIQDVARATLGAAWIDEEGRLIYRGRDEMRAAPITAWVDALDTLEDVPWSSGLDEVADRVEVTYREPVVSRNFDDTLTVWESDESLAVRPGKTLTLTRDIEGAASGLAWWERAEDVSTIPINQKSRYWAWTAPPGEDGSAPAASALVIDATMITPSRVRIRIRNTTGATLYIYRLILRAMTLAAAGEPLTIASGATAANAETPLSIDLGSFVQDGDAAQRILAWLTSQTSTPNPTIRDVRVPPDATRRLGDTVLVRIRPTLDAEALTFKAMISGVSNAARDGELTQALSFTLLDPTENDLAAYFVAQGIDTEADVAAHWTALGLTTENDVAAWINRGGLYI